MRRIAIVLALVSTLVSLAVDARPSQEPAPVRYLVITAGRTAGEQVVRQIGGGRIEATFEFNDRGRGPKTLSRIDVGDGGVPTRIEVTGNDYYKNTVSETFSVENGIARIEKVLPEIHELAQGGTAVGTGLNTKKGWEDRKSVV